MILCRALHPNGPYNDDFDTRSALNSIARWDVVGQKVLKIILLKGDLRRSLALTSSHFFLILMIHYFSGYNDYKKCFNTINVSAGTTEEAISMGMAVAWAFLFI